MKKQIFNKSNGYSKNILKPIRVSTFIAKLNLKLKLRKKLKLKFLYVVFLLTTSQKNVKFDFLYFPLSFLFFHVLIRAANFSY